MTKAKRKRIVKPKEVKKEEQVMDGLNMPFDEVMKMLVQPNNGKDNKSETP